MNREHRRKEKKRDVVHSVDTLSWTLFQCFLLPERREANIKTPFINSTKSDIFFLLHKKAHARTHPTIDFGECVILLIIFVLVVAVNFNFSVWKSFTPPEIIFPINWILNLREMWTRNTVNDEKKKLWKIWFCSKFIYRYIIGVVQWNGRFNYVWTWQRPSHRTNICLIHENSRKLPTKQCDLWQQFSK